jgi:uncharacterized protein (DUF697 family)
MPISIGTLRALYKELSVSGQSGKPLVVGGARALAPALRRELGVSGSDTPEGGAVYVHIWAGDGEDEAQLKRARRARVPIVALAPGDLDHVPYVLATDLVPLGPGEGFPVAALCTVIAARLGEEAAPLAARVPALRRPVAEELVGSFARRNGLVGAAVFMEGVDLPVLARNQLRLVLRLWQAYGHAADPQERAPEIAATLAAGVGLRGLARRLVGLRVVPVPRWAVQGAVAYAGTRALGEAAIRRLEAAQGRHGPTRPPGEASRAEP